MKSRSIDAAFNKFYAQYHPVALTIALVFAKKSGVDGEDIAARVMVKIYKKFETLTLDDHAKTMAFLRRCLANEFVDAYRKKKREVSLEAMTENGFEPNDGATSSYPHGNPWGPTNGNPPFRPDNMIHCEEVIRSVPKQFKKLVLLMVQDYNGEDIAAILGLTHGAVRNKIGTLRRWMNEQPAQ